MNKFDIMLINIFYNIFEINLSCIINMSYFFNILINYDKNILKKHGGIIVIYL
jgi:hypothetical protein